MSLSNQLACLRKQTHQKIHGIKICSRRSWTKTISSGRLNAMLGTSCLQAVSSAYHLTFFNISADLWCHRKRLYLQRIQSRPQRVGKKNIVDLCTSPRLRPRTPKGQIHMPTLPSRFHATRIVLSSFQDPPSKARAAESRKISMRRSANKSKTICFSSQILNKR